MARSGTLFFGANGTLLAVPAATKTLIQLLAAANHPIELVSFGVWGDSTDLQAAQIKAELTRQSDAGTMSAGTISPGNEDDPIAFDTTGFENATAEPTFGSVLLPFMFPPSSGFTYTWPPDDRPTVGSAKRLGLRVLSPAASFNSNGFITFRE